MMRNLDGGDCEEPMRLVPLAARAFCFASISRLLSSTSLRRSSHRAVRRPTWKRDTSLSEATVLRPSCKVNAYCWVHMGGSHVKRNAGCEMQGISDQRPHAIVCMQQKFPHT